MYISAFYGVIFPRTTEAAFSNASLWESLGFIMAYAYSASLCTDSKTYIMIVCLLLGMLGYAAIEIIEKHKLLRRDENGECLSIIELATTSKKN